ncbi:MAG: hypothetical protein KAI43_08315 [Candidatus Aureabacteria bacterium]|nr:hypothetical protein [Candidatus Auribacterota bacterium]
MIIYEEIFSAFHREKVKYVVIGGIAVNLLGLLRSTADLDVLMEMSNKNLEKVIKILKKHDYFIKVPIDPISIVDKKVRDNLIKEKHMKALNFYKKKTLEEVDILIDSPVSYSQAKKTSKRIKAGKITIPVISLDNLIKMKKKAGRSIDKFDIEELKKIKKISGKK